MKFFNKSLKEYFNSIKIFILIIFILSIIQVTLAILGYLPKIELIKVSNNAAILKMNYLNPITIITILEIILVFVSGFYLVLKNKFKLRNNFISSIFLFISSMLIIFFIPLVLPQMPMIFKIINFSILFIVNIIIFIIASLFGGMLALLYKKIRK